MKHNIRQRQLDPNTGLIVTKIVKVEGELGSGVLDKNGKEIFEGDKIKVYYSQEEFDTFIVEFKHGIFWLGYRVVYGFNSADLEVVGHEED